MFSNSRLNPHMHVIVLLSPFLCALNASIDLGSAKMHLSCLQQYDVIILDGRNPRFKNRHARVNERLEAFRGLLKATVDRASAHFKNVRVEQMPLNICMQ